MALDFNINITTPLCEIMERHGSDKGSTKLFTGWHNYTTFYYSLFKDKQLDSLRIFELGLGTNNIKMKSNMGKDGRPGASLYGWSEFFKNSCVFGADIDKDILFNADKIKTYYCDQTSKKDIEDLWRNSDLHDNFDIIIEDGLHEYEANIIFFENSIHKLNLNGVYIIEDICKNNLDLFRSKIKEWELKYTNLKFDLVEIPNKSNNWDNNVLLVRS
jgi:hypothetical protein